MGAALRGQQHRRILVVDDSPEIRDILLTALRRRFLVVDQARDGAEAIALLRENTYAVVLLDLLMPEVDGFAVLDAIDHDAAHQPVVLVVTAADASVTTRAAARKIHGIVKKPFDPMEVAQIVADCAEIRGRGAFETMALATIVTGAAMHWLSQ